VGTVEIGGIAVLTTSLLILLGSCVAAGFLRAHRLRERELHRKAVLLAIQPWTRGRKTAEGRRRDRTI
jgi:hypothetical protein